MTDSFEQQQTPQEQTSLLHDWRLRAAVFGSTLVAAAGVPFMIDGSPASADSTGPTGVSGATGTTGETGATGVTSDPIGAIEFCEDAAVGMFGGPKYSLIEQGNFKAIGKIGHKAVHISLKLHKYDVVAGSVDDGSCAKYTEDTVTLQIGQFKKGAKSTLNSTGSIPVGKSVVVYGSHSQVPLQPYQYNKATVSRTATLFLPNALDRAAQAHDEVLATITSIPNPKLGLSGPTKTSPPQVFKITTG